MPGRFAGEEAAESEAIGPVLLVGILVVLAATLSLIVWAWLNQPEAEVVTSGAKATFGTDGYWVEPTGPQDIPVDGSRLFIRIDGVQTIVPLSNFSGALSSPTIWQVGERICIVGSHASCWRDTGNSIELTLFTRSNYVFNVRNLLSQDAPFAKSGDGGSITISNTIPLRVNNIGSAITCGASGPTIPVVARFTQDGGATWTNLWGGNPVQTAPNPPLSQNVTFAAIPKGAVVGVEGRTLSTGGCTGVTYASTTADPHVLVLGPGDPAPNKPAYGGQAPLESFLAPYVNTFTQTMVLNPNQLIVLFEFSSDLSGSAADFQDLVILFTFG